MADVQAVPPWGRAGLHAISPGRHALHHSGIPAVDRVFRTGERIMMAEQVSEIDGRTGTDVLLDRHGRDRMG
jgi:hypothetical protein